MFTDLRNYPRQEIQIDITLYFLEDSPHAVVSKNISEGGLFLLLDDPQHYPLGELVSLHFRNPLGDNSETEKDAVIVRTNDEGIAVAFIDMEAF